MRTLTTIITIVLMLTCGSLLSHKYIQTSTHSLLTQLETVQQSITDRKWQNAQTVLDSTYESWDKNKTWWSILLNHDEIDGIDVTMERLEKYMTTENKSLSLGEVSTLILLFDHIVDTDQLTVRNIL